ncbi:MAG: hypothetical protein PHY02_05880 [Phycisphaerae bacterium]|nr:hypothetical protein [Phycisphaerae bacterium]
MQRKYLTKKGSVYIQSIKAGGKELWIKEDKNGKIETLLGGIHISKKRFSELLKEYPSSLLDKTYCFDLDTEREFFEDARREKFIGNIEDEDTVVFSSSKKDPTNTESDAAVRLRK